MLSFKRRGIVDCAHAHTGSTALRAVVSLSFDPSTTSNANNAAAPFHFSFESPVFLISDEAKASLTRTQRINSTFTSIRPRIRLALALHIHPSSIVSISFSRLSALPDRLVPIYHRLAAGPSVVALQFKLASPPVLAVPNIPGPLMPATRADLNILKAFQDIAGGATVTGHASDGSTLTVYLPAPSLTDGQASSLCASVPPVAIEAGALPSRERSLELQLDGLFGGLGARLVPLTEVATLVDSTSPTASPSSHSDVNSSPPSYDNFAEPLAKTSTGTGTAPSPPPPPSYQAPEISKPLAADEHRPQKRKRMDSSKKKNHDNGE